MKRALLLLPLLAATGCVSTAKSIVEAPFKVVGKAADLATTSQSEADRNRGRALRKAEDRAQQACRQEVTGDVAQQECVREKLHQGGFN